MSEAREGWNYRFQKHPAVGTRSDSGQYRPRLAAGLPFAVPEFLGFVAFRDSGKPFKQFSRTFLEFSSGTPKQIPETATAFSSCLILGHFLGAPRET